MTSGLNNDNKPTSKSLLDVLNTGNYPGLFSQSTTSPSLQNISENPHLPTNLDPFKEVNHSNQPPTRSNDLSDNKATFISSSLQNHEESPPKNTWDVSSNQPVSSDALNSMSPQQRETYKLMQLLKGVNNLVDIKSPSPKELQDPKKLQKSESDSTNPTKKQDSSEPKFPKFEVPINPFLIVSPKTLQDAQSSPQKTNKSPSESENNQKIETRKLEKTQSITSPKQKQSESKKSRKKKTKKFEALIPYGDPKIQSKSHIIEPIAIVTTPLGAPVGRAIGASRSYICYGKKRGDVRIIQQWGLRHGLLVGHTNDVTDIQIHPMSQHQPGSKELLATAGKDGNVIFWTLGSTNPKPSDTKSNQNDSSEVPIENKEIARFTSDPKDPFISMAWCPGFYCVKSENTDLAVMAIATEKNIYLLTIANHNNFSTKKPKNLLVDKRQISLNEPVSSMVWVKRKIGWDLFVCTKRGFLKRVSGSDAPNSTLLELEVVSTSMGSNINWMKWVSPRSNLEGLGHLLVSRSQSNSVELRWLGQDGDTVGGNVGNVVQKLIIEATENTSQNEDQNTSEETPINPDLTSPTLEYEDDSHVLIVAPKTRPSLIFVPIDINPQNPSHAHFETSHHNTGNKSEDSSVRSIIEVPTKESQLSINIDVVAEQPERNQVLLGVYCISTKSIDQYQLSIPITKEPYSLNSIENDFDESHPSSLYWLMLANGQAVSENSAERITPSGENSENQSSKLSGAEYLHWMIGQAASLRPRALSTNQGTAGTSEYEVALSAADDHEFVSTSSLNNAIFQNSSRKLDLEDSKSICSVEVHPSHTPKISARKIDRDPSVFSETSSISGDPNRSAPASEINSTTPYQHGSNNSDNNLQNTNDKSNSYSTNSSAPQTNHVSKSTLKSRTTENNNLERKSKERIQNIVKSCVNEAVREVMFSEEYKSMLMSSIESGMMLVFQSSFNEMLQNSVQSTMQNYLLPAYGRATAEMFEQINNSFSSGISSSINSAADAFSKTVANYEQKLVESRTKHTPPVNITNGLQPGQGIPQNLSNNNPMMMNELRSAFGISSGQQQPIMNQSQQNFQQSEQMPSPQHFQTAFQQQQTEQMPVPVHNDSQLPMSQHYVPTQQLQQVQGQMMQPQMNMATQQMMLQGFPFQQNLGQQIHLIQPQPAGPPMIPTNQQVDQIRNPTNVVPSINEARINSLKSLLNSGKSLNFQAQPQITAGQVPSPPNQMFASPQQKVPLTPTTTNGLNMAKQISCIINHEQLDVSSEPMSPGHTPSPRKKKERISDSDFKLKAEATKISKSSSQKSKQQKDLMLQVLGAQSKKRGASQPGKESSVSSQIPISISSTRSTAGDSVSAGHPNESVASNEIDRIIERSGDPRDILLLALSTRVEKNKGVSSISSNPLHQLYSTCSKINPQDLASDKIEVDIQFLFSLIYGLVINHNLAKENYKLVVEWLSVLFSKLRKLNVNGKVSNQYGWTMASLSDKESIEGADLECKTEHCSSFRDTMESLSRASQYIDNNGVLDDGQDLQLVPVRDAILSCLEVVATELEESDEDSDVRLLAKARTFIRLVQSL
ncbi:hypothetical protein BB559_002748 [Furculomyces boomerangus]|uniref:Uncharacterized protein n=2 Tax=Harpellales TaxID=61421 RepID=A0A2T9YSV2_9FUNG|nr:hypothetical protein BB559_002748 [Furculomyces boomerangus]PVZ97334.1 hypothetical protein BB558_006695 [Smittium angustum]PVZ99174.1 hypothetical protein BB558_004816 [Smittium angustum]